jgi:hypothetical protein
MKLAASLARKAMRFATSSAWPRRPIGCLLMRKFLASSPMVASSGVSMKPGPTEFTRTPCAEYSRAADLVMPTTACLAAT